MCFQRPICGSPMGQGVPFVRARPIQRLSGSNPPGNRLVPPFAQTGASSYSFGYLGASRARVKDLGLIEPNVAVTGGRVGSLVGLLGDGTVTGCYVEGGSVSGSHAVGGLVGWNWAGKITDCYATVSVSGHEEVGGLVGRKGYSYWPGVFPAEISNCYSAGSVSADRHVGGLIGYSYIGQVSNSFWDVETSGQPDSDGGTGKTTAEMQTAGTFLDAGWDFVNETENGAEDIWCICEEPDYPTFAGLSFLQ